MCGHEGMSLALLGSRDIKYTECIESICAVATYRNTSPLSGMNRTEKHVVLLDSGRQAVCVSVCVCVCVCASACVSVCVCVCA